MKTLNLIEMSRAGSRKRDPVSPVSSRLIRDRGSVAPSPKSIGTARPLPGAKSDKSKPPTRADSFLEARPFPGDDSDELTEQKQRLVDELRALEQEIYGKQAKHDKLKAEIELLQMARDEGE
jgi:hypothetical protein